MYEKQGPKRGEHVGKVGRKILIEGFWGPSTPTC